MTKANDIDTKINLANILRLTNSNVTVGDLFNKNESKIDISKYGIGFVDYSNYLKGNK